MKEATEYNKTRISSLSTRLEVYLQFVLHRWVMVWKRRWNLRNSKFSGKTAVLKRGRELNKPTAWEKNIEIQLVIAQIILASPNVQTVRTNSKYFTGIGCFLIILLYKKYLSNLIKIEGFGFFFFSLNDVLLGVSEGKSQRSS